MATISASTEVNSKGNPPEGLHSGWHPSNEECYFETALKAIPREKLKGIAALDIGCGRKFRDIGLLHKYGASDLVGVDVFESSITDFQHGDVSYVRADVDDAALPFSDETYNLIVIDNMIEHLYNPMQVLNECHRVLKADGTLFVLTPNQARLKNRLKLLIGGSIYYPLEYWTKPGRMWITKNGRRVFAGHIREYTPTETKRMIESAGFKIESLKLANAQRASGLDPSLDARSSDTIESRLNSRTILSLYHCAETAFPPWRTMIVVEASKTSQ